MKTKKIRFGVSGQSNPFKKPEKPNISGFYKSLKPSTDLHKKKFNSTSEDRVSQKEWRKKGDPSQDSQKNKNTAIGLIKRHPDGYGFLIPDDKTAVDVYVPKNFMNGAMTNDRVEVRFYPDGDRFRGEIIKIVSRETQLISGPLQKRSSTAGIIPDSSHAWGEDLKVTIPVSLKPQEGDWVLAQIHTYPDHVRGFQGEVIKVIGALDEALNDNLRVLIEHHIPIEFSAAARQEAKNIPTEVLPEDWQGRKDLTDKKFITIDGVTAKDFDDAIYVEKQKNGFRLWVAIADVSHYVKPHTAIDKDAYERGTSTYFPGFVAPMLPEALSNEICSLKPHVDRLTFTCEMFIDFKGNLHEWNFYEAVIHSHARVTYGEAQQVIDGGTVDKLISVEKNILLAAELARCLMARRFEEGSLNLEVPETVIEVDKGGEPLDIIKSERLFAHRLIEELMLVANKATARFMSDKKIPGIYRVHESPKPDALMNLEAFLQTLGYTKHLSEPHLQKKISAALAHFAGQPQETVINILTLRSMMQAKYSTDNVGHFGLGFAFYSHFTSPIRRYPDLIAHRLIKAVILKHKGYRLMSAEELATACSLLSGCEQRSVKAERQIQAIKKARFMHKHLGEEFDGLVSSVTKFGVFVLLRQFEIDGLVRIEDLSQDRMDFDEESLTLVSRRSGFKVTIGDPLRIQIVSVDIQNGRIDFAPVEGAIKGVQGRNADTQQSFSSTKKSSFQKRGANEDHRERVHEARVSRSGRKNNSPSSLRSRQNRRRSRKNNKN